jgi:amino acid adenylation domain-containing protein
MHDVFSGVARKFPAKEAISSWDGNLTYDQIDRYSSFLAKSLHDSGVVLHDFIPICFEKSRWTIVAVLAVMKAGGTLVMMDPTLPLARLQNMAKQVGSKTIVSSRMQYDLSMEILQDGKHFVVEEDAYASLPTSETLPELPTVPSTTLMYLIFTSGSTGTPKGVKISHGTYTSSAFPRAKAVGYNENWRVLDFASYAFDVSIDSMLLTLANGGCLCIPSDQDRLNDINEVIRKMKINYAGITPSVARILDPDVISSLEGLGLGGEAASARDVTLWGQDTRIIIGYGPCECTIGCNVNSNAATGRDYVSIGPGNGASIWIVDPNDHERLMPVGAVGELLVEGPIVGQGYLNDPEKTAASFIEDPSWLIAGHKGYAGRRGRLYKTGDLGRYDPDGSAGIVFAGRKDTQVKLRGQRVELGEIESQLQARLPSGITVIAEVIVPQRSGGQATLVTFVASQSAKGDANMELVSVPMDELRDTFSEADAEIAKVLPRYMLPTAYIPVNYMPTLISGKTDRKRLRQLGTTVDLRQLDQGTMSAASRPLNEVEVRLRQAWSEILKVGRESIRLEDNFFALGGDSLGAMKLVSVCRTQGLDLSVTGTFGHPTLLAMAEVVHAIDADARAETAAFSLISQSVESACLEASQICRSDLTAVEDIYPCTPTQESLFTFSLKSVEAYIAQRVSLIPSDIHIDAWKKAWADVVAESPILRTRLAQLQDPGLQQVVLKETISWRQSSDLTQYLENDRKERMHLGESLARYAIVNDSHDGKQYMVWTVHHVLYDGWSEPLILEKVQNSLKIQPIEPQKQMRDFVKWFRDTDEVAMQDFWRRELKGAVGPQFPRLPYRDYLPTPSGFVEHHIPFEIAAGSPFTLATLIRGAWALVASQYTGSDDVVFGETLTGRDIALAGVENVLGPLNATIPIRVHVNRKNSVESYLQSVQQTMLARTPYQHMGMQFIRKVSQDAQHACEAGTGLVIQPEPEYEVSPLGFQQGDPAREALHFNPYPLMLACGIRKGGFRVCTSFDTSLITEPQMKRILAQLEMAVLQLNKDLSKGIDQISCLPEAELNQIWRLNELPPMSLDEASGKPRADVAIKQGSAYPRAAVPWVCDTRNPGRLLPICCTGELWLESALLMGESIEPPVWLASGSTEIPGRSGRLQSTGDIVQLQEDGSLIFVGRKENIVPVQGHAVDMTEFETQFARHLPASTRAAAAISKSSSEPELLIFIEQQKFKDESVRVISANQDIYVESASQQRFKSTICATISVNLAAAINKLDKFIRDDFPSHMIPSSYVVVSEMPTTKGEIDHKLLSQLASKIPNNVFSELQEGFKDACKKASAQANLSASESILQAAWAKILGLSTEQIDVDDNFFRLGGDSVLAMKLVSSLRSQGHTLSVADIFQHMRLGDAARVLKVGQAVTAKVQLYKPFSTLGSLNKVQFLSEVVQPKLGSSSWPIQDVSLVTDSQVVDVKGTIQVPRTAVQYTMLYFNNGIYRKQLLRACRDLVKVHEILRTVFIESDSTFYQVVLSDLDVPVTMHKADKDLEQFVTEICAEQTESDFHLGSPFLKMHHVEGKNGRECLVLGLSHAQYDGMSLPRLLQDLETLYTGGKVANFEPFSSYVAWTANESVQAKAVTYWRNLLDGSSLSVLPGTTTQHGDKGTFQTKAVDNFQPVEEITTANILTAAWALLLARRLRKQDVTFGGVTSGRMIDLPNVENIMGPCYQLTPIRVPFQNHWTAIDLLHFVQKQSAQSATYDFLGFKKISSQCTQWSPEVACFDSLVHHQDWDDFDTMPFAGGSCKVDISNPHGDSPYPFKVVSFVKDEKMHVGVVGSERDSAFAGEILHELATTVEELSTRREATLVADELF